jgi:hypothetical protein
VTEERQPFQNQTGVFQLRMVRRPFSWHISKKLGFHTYIRKFAARQIVSKSGCLLNWCVFCWIVSSGVSSGLFNLTSPKTYGSWRSHS